MFARIVCLAMCLIAQFGQAQTTFTSNGNGDWDDAATWIETGDDDPDDIPDANDIVVISVIDTVFMTTSGTFGVDDLTINGVLDFPSNNRTLNVGGNLVMGGTSCSINGNNNNRIVNVTGTFDISSGATAVITGVQLNVTGTTTVDGTLSFTATRGDKIFTSIDVNASGHWNNNSAEDFVISGNIINDGTWTGCSAANCTYDLTSTSGTISGSATVSMADILINSPASITNNGILELTDDITGTGTFTNGATGDFQISGSNNLTLSSLVFTTVGNTVTYVGGSNPNALTTTFYNLVVNKPGQRLGINSNVIVNNDVTVTAGELRIAATGDLDVTGDILISGGEFSPNNDGGLVDVTGDINMSSGTFDYNDGDVTVTGDLIVTGGTMTMNQGSAVSTFNVSDVTISTGTVTLSEGELNVTNASGGLTVNSGTLTLGGTAVDVAGTYQVSGGTNDVNSGTLNVVDLTVDNGQTLLLGSGTMVGTGTTTVNGTLTVDGNGGDKTLNDLTVSATGNWNVTAAESFTINGNISSNGTWTGCSSAACVYTLTSSSGTISGSTQVSVGTMTIDSPGSYTSTGSVLINNDFLGTGSFTNGNGSTLELNGAGPFTITTLDASANSNTVTYSGGSAVTVNGATYHNLVINKSANTATISSATTVNNDLTVTAVILALGATTLNVGNDIIINGGEFTPGDPASIVNVTGDINMSSGLFDHNDGDVTITGDLIITGGTFSINESDGNISTFNMDDFSITTGTATLSEGELNVTNASGGLTVNSGSLTLAGTAVVVTNFYNLDGGTNDFNTGSFSAASLDIASSQTLTVAGLTFTISGTTDINGTLTFDNNNGTKNFGDINVNSGGAWDNNTSADFTISGSISSNGTSWTGCSANGCDYTLTSSSGTISGSTALDISDIIINSPASYTNTANLSVSDRITGTGTFVNGASASLDYSGNNNAGANFDITNFTASATGNTVTFSRAGDQRLRSTTDSDNNYYNVVISTTAAGNDVSLDGDITIDNQLTLNLGDLILGTNRLTIADGTTISGGSTDSYIAINSSGVLRQNYTAAGSTLAFPIGDADEYSPITAFTINSATFGAGAYLEFSITDANHPNRDTSNTPTGDDDGTAAVAYISRYWTVTPNAITSPNYNADYVYLDADVTGTESDIVGTLYRTHPTLGILDWFVTGTVNTTTNTVSLTEADAFGDLYAMDNTLQRLPIVLVSFEAMFTEGQVKLKWVTASEDNNSFFTVERSLNGRDFEEVLLHPGAGNSQTLIHYEATDTNPPVGRIFYRLKQTDFNGTFAYSELVAVDVTSSREALEFTIFGNVAERGSRVRLNRNLAGEGQLILQGMDGKSNRTYLLSQAAGLDFDLDLNGGMSPGLYVLQLIQSGEKVSRKLIVR